MAANQQLLKRIILIICGSIVGAFALLFILSKLIHVDVDSMGGDTVHPPYPFIHDVEYTGFSQHFSIEELASAQTEIPLSDDDKGYGSRVIFWNDEYSNELHIELDVEEAGDYFFAVDYLSDDTTVKPNEISIEVNSEVVPNATSMRLLTQWAYSDHDVQFDIYKNQVYPQNLPVSIWNRVFLRDQLFLYQSPIIFTLNEGINEITITKEQGSFYLGDLRIYDATEDLNYQNYLLSNVSTPIEDQMIIIEAEKYTFKNSISVIPETDKTPSVSPFSSEQHYLNIIGNSFSEIGDQLTYFFDVEQSGYYNITLKYKNTIYENRDVYRNIYVNGAVLFNELSSYPLSYSTDWKNETLSSSDEDLLIYLDEGLNSITIEVDASLYGKHYETVQRIIDEISEYGIKLKKLTGGETDENREWDINAFIPETQSLFDGWYEDLSEVNEAIENMSSNPRQSTQIQKQLEIGLEKLSTLKNDIDKIPHRMNLLSVGSNSLSQLLSLINQQMIDQPLSLDKIYIHSEDSKLPKENANFLKEWIAGMQIYQAASTFETTDEYDIEVWVNRSRYYISMMQQMTDSTFTEETGIRVKYAVMPNEQKLILANAANTQPDMALGISAWLPYELGLRGAAADMRQFDGFTEVIDQLMPGSFLNMIHDTQVFGLPETQDFTVTYYRKDVMDALELDVPNTYDEIVGILPTLQRYGMNYYLPLSADSALKGFAATAPFVYQHGSQLYSEDGFDVLIDQPSALDGINTMVDLYTLYSLPLQVPNFYNSFRESTIPIGVSSFNTYVQLTFAAPEISNKWEISLAPGVDDGTGYIRRDHTGAAQASVIFQKSEHKEEAWELLKWWMSAEIQTWFMHNLLVTYGEGFLWNSANVEAFKSLPIPEEHINIILEQWEHLQEVPKVPGGYKLERELSNIWNRVVFDGVDVRSAVDDAKLLIERELVRKYQEFGYIDQDGMMIKPYTITTKEDVMSWIEEGE
ncbi:MAG: extracellular solute-binding protein [Firmicutes bacterium]|nr:extracellular solute-binding protein [Bacillota bacterium]